jgi:hypothetical protein
VVRSSPDPRTPRSELESDFYKLLLRPNFQLSDQPCALRCDLLGIAANLLRNHLVRLALGETAQ